MDGPSRGVPRARGLLAGPELTARALPIRPLARTGYHQRAWSTEDGLPENSATAIVQPRDGYLRFGTFRVLVRDNGDKFVVFDPATTPQLPNREVVNLHADQRGWLWVSTLAGLVVNWPEGGACFCFTVPVARGQWPGASGEGRVARGR